MCILASTSPVGIPFTIVFLCENVQLALMVSSRIATGGHRSFAETGESISAQW